MTLFNVIVRRQTLSDPKRYEEKNSILSANYLFSLPYFAVKFGLTTCSCETSSFYYL